ncbi:MAG: hypothetical protein LBU38_03820 [Propionibacteriaceae bacterium]|jgi:hypothetical protein|nr:hypothetical protein [Propionibacteriaceae bacterium]
MSQQYPSQQYPQYSSNPQGFPPPTSDYASTLDGVLKWSMILAWVVAAVQALTAIVQPVFGLIELVTDGFVMGVISTGVGIALAVVNIFLYAKVAVQIKGRDMKVIDTLLIAIAVQAATPAIGNIFGLLGGHFRLTGIISSLISGTLAFAVGCVLVLLYVGRSARVRAWFQIPQGHMPIEQSKWYDLLVKLPFVITSDPRSSSTGDFKGFKDTFVSTVQNSQARTQAPPQAAPFIPQAAPFAPQAPNPRTAGEQPRQGGWPQA